jgi:hypothetical protein
MRQCSHWQRHGAHLREQIRPYGPRFSNPRPLRESGGEGDSAMGLSAAGEGPARGSPWPSAKGTHRHARKRVLGHDSQR